MTSKASKAALLLALLSRVYAYVPMGKVIIIQAGLRDAPWRVNETMWPAIMANPDIEKTYPIVGYNMTMPFPGEEIDGVDGFCERPEERPCQREHRNG